MLDVCLASMLALTALATTEEVSGDALSSAASAIEEKVVALSQQNRAMDAGKIAAQAMRKSDLPRGDRYQLGGLAFEAYIVAHINDPSVEALCEARRVARAMKQVAGTPEEMAAARGLAGQANAELAKMQPPGQCAAVGARPSKRVPTPMATAEAGSAEPVPELLAKPTEVAPVASSPPAAASSSSSVVTATGPASPPKATLPGPLSTPPAPRPGPLRVQWTPRAWAGLGSVLLGSGLFAGMGASLRGRALANGVIVDLDRQLEAENREPTPDETMRTQQANLRWQRLTTTAVITGSVGAAALVTGVVLLATGVRRRPVEMSPWGGQTSAGLVVSGRF